MKFKNLIPIIIIIFILSVFTVDAIVQNFYVDVNMKGYDIVNATMIGIGTSTPDHILDVIGNMSVSGNISLSDNNFAGMNSSCTVIMSPGGTGILNICD